MLPAGAPVVGPMGFLIAIEVLEGVEGTVVIGFDAFGLLPTALPPLGLF